MNRTPRPTVVALVATLVLTIAALSRFLAEEHRSDSVAAYLVVFGGLFAVRVVGQVAVIAFKPAWLPPSSAWNFLPYPLLLPAQLVLLAVIGAVVSGREGFGPTPVLVFAALAYWSAMGVRYALRMARRPAERWFGGTIPIVFHCVLAALVFVLGVAGTGT